MKRTLTPLVALLLAPLGALQAADPKAQTTIPSAPAKRGELPAQLPASNRHRAVHYSAKLPPLP
jgi:hypothetical protein